jgi:hypothetical protein
MDGMRAFPNDVVIVDENGNEVEVTSPVIFTPEEVARLEREGK